VAEQGRAHLVRVRVERGQHGLGVTGPLVPPVAQGQGDQAGEERGDDPGPRVGVRVDSLAPGERGGEVLVVVVEVAQVSGEQRRRGLDEPAARSFDIPGIALLFGLSRIGAESGLNDTIVWFALLGLGLSPVMVGATDVIVGNASVQMAGVAGGLQSTAMQVGGTIGTAVLGAIMSAHVDSLLPARWAAAVVALAGAAIALLTKRGRAVEGAAAV
jgi:hypothetical protein